MKFEIKHFWEKILSVILLSIMMSGLNILQNGILFRGLLVVAIIVLNLIFKNLNIHLYDSIQYYILFFIVWIDISLFRTYDSAYFLNYFVNYFYIFIIVFISISGSSFQNMLFIAEKILTVYGASIFLALLFGENLFIKIFGWIYLNKNSIHKEFLEGFYSGFAAEKAQAAFLMNLGFGYTLAKCFANKRMSKVDIFKLLFYFLATLLTGKRTLCLVEVVLSIFFYSFSDIKYKIKKLFGIVVSIGLVGIIVMKLVPAFMVTFTRFQQKAESDDMLSGRQLFWDCCKEMVREKPLLGHGLGSFNMYFSTHHFSWDNHAHNCFYQMAAELGLLGLGIFVIINIILIKRIISLYSVRKNLSVQHNFMCYYGTYIVILYLIYSLTGNPFYNGNQLIWYVLGLNIIIITFYEAKGEYINEKNRNIDVS